MHKLGNVSTSASPSSQPVESQVSASSTSRHNGSNVFQLLAWREISPRAKHSSRSLWGEASKCNVRPKFDVTDARHGLVSWVEAESLWHLSAKYCPLAPPPRSTIAAAFSPDGQTLASTHGDHTVKIIDCQTGRCLKVLSGHRRTPWVVRFHPLHPEILASGSLDHEVRLWDANTAECIESRDFYRPIASIAFHAQGELLAVASGHKLYVWHYNRSRDTSSPTVVLKTRRSLRAVHFHPHAAPYLLTAEVNDLDSPDSTMAVATSPGYPHYPPLCYTVRQNLETEAPLVPLPFLFWPTSARDDGRDSLQHGNRAVASSTSHQRVETSTSMQLQGDSTTGNQDDYLVSPMEMSPVIPSISYHVTEGTVNNDFSGGMETLVSNFAMDTVEATEGHPVADNQQRSFAMVDTLDISGSLPDRTNMQSSVAHLSNLSGSTGLQMLARNAEVGQIGRYSPDPSWWELPFFQGWLMGQTQAGLHPILPRNDAPHENTSQSHGMVSDISATDLATCNLHVPVASAVMPIGVSHSRVTSRSGSRHRSSRSRFRLIASTGSGEGASFVNIARNESDSQPVGRIESEVATTTVELPCTVKLRIWPHDIKDPCAPLDAESCRLTIPHAVLCSEMGAHFSPCGRFLAACVACVLPNTESDHGLQSQVYHDVNGASTSPTRHPISAQQVMYELRIYSLEAATFGLVLASRAIRAANCLTSIQFSPTSEHVLLAYGRRHASLLRGLVIDGETTMPIYTILEVYRVSDMELVRVLPSAEDEVNVACFHPLVGGGLVYGTKEGKLRILQYDGSHGTIGSNFFLEDYMMEVE